MSLSSLLLTLTEWKIRNIKQKVMKFEGGKILSWDELQRLQKYDHIYQVGY